MVHLAADGTEILRGHGFLISGEGLLVTNYHLVVRAKRLRATLASGDIYDQVSLKALDPAADLAILKIAAFNAPYVPLSSGRPRPETCWRWRLAEALHRAFCRLTGGRDPQASWDRMRVSFCPAPP